MNDNHTCADLLKARTILTGIFFITYCLLCFFVKPIPPLLEKIVLGLLGVWFGEKAIKWIEEKVKNNGGGQK